MNYYYSVSDEYEHVVKNLKAIEKLERDLAEVKEHLRCAEDAQDYRIQGKMFGINNQLVPKIPTHEMLKALAGEPLILSASDEEELCKRYAAMLEAAPTR